MKRSRIALRLGASLAVMAGALVSLGAPPAFAGTLSPGGGSLPPAQYVDGVAQAYTSPPISTSDTCTSAAPCTWTAKTLPAGLTITANSANFGATATITGTPTSGVVTSSVVVTQSGGTGGTSTATYVVSVIDSMTSVGSFGGHAQFPTGVIADQSRKYIYVAGFDSNAINVINGTTKTNLPTVSNSPMAFAAGQLNEPFGMALSAESPAPVTLWTTNFGGGNGAKITLPAPGTNPATVPVGVCQNPSGMSHDSASPPTGYWVSCAGSGTVAFLNDSGVFQRAIALPSCAKGQAVPSGVSQSNQNGFITVVDARCDAMYELSPTAITATLALPAGAYSANTTFSTVNCQCVDVAEPGLNQVQQILISSSTTMSIRNTMAAGNRPYGVTTDGTSGSILAIANAGTRTFTNPSVQFYTLTTTPTLNYTVALPNGDVPDGVGDIPGSGSQNNLAYVATEQGNSVVVVDPPSGGKENQLLNAPPSAQPDAASQAASALAVNEHHPLSP